MLCCLLFYQRERGGGPGKREQYLPPEEGEMGHKNQEIEAGWGNSDLSGVGLFVNFGKMIMIFK